MRFQQASGQGRSAAASDPDQAATRRLTGLGKFLSAYRGQLPRAEAARRSGLSEARWAEVEADSGTRIVPAHTVATMCAAVGADVATGLKLAGHDPDRFGYLVTAPPGLMHLRPALSPFITNYRAVGDVVASPAEDPRAPLSVIYRETAERNHRLAEGLRKEPPDGRTDFWEGYAAALHALADEQLRVAEQDTGR